MSKYRRRTQTPPPPPPPNSGYQSIKSTETSSTTQAARNPDSTKVQRGGDDGFIPIKPAASRRRPPKRNSWSKKDVVEIVSLVAVAATVIGVGVTLTYRLGTVGEKVNAIAGDVTTVKEGQIADHGKIEEVRSDVIELRRDVRDLREAPAAAPRPSKLK